MDVRLRYVFVSCALSAVAVFSTPASSRSAEDNGVREEDSLQRRSMALFGFGNPVAESADTPSSTKAGDLAVEVAGDLRVRVISSKVGENADMIALWPDDANAEFTGIQFLADGKSFLIHLQHRTQDGRAVPHTTDMLLVSGLRIAK